MFKKHNSRFKNILMFLEYINAYINLRYINTNQNCKLDKKITKHRKTELISIWGFILCISIHDFLLKHEQIT